MMSDIPIQQSQSPGILWRKKNSLQKVSYAVFQLSCNAEDKKSQGTLSQQLYKTESPFFWSPLSLAPCFTNSSPWQLAPKAFLLPPMQWTNHELL